MNTKDKNEKTIELIKSMLEDVSVEDMTELERRIYFAVGGTSDVPYSVNKENSMKLID